MIVIAGKNNIAVHALNVLLNRFPVSDIAVVLNATDDGIDGWQLSFRKKSEELGVKIISLELAEQAADVFISLEFDRIVKPARFRDASKIFNIHFSALPSYKGMYTSIWPILHGDERSAVTLHRIDAGIDTGEIVDQIFFDLVESDSSKDLYLKYIDNAIALLDKNISSIISGDVVSENQEAKGSSYFSKTSIDFAKLNFNFYQTAWQIGRFLKAFAFRNYQMPSWNGEVYCNYEILATGSTARPGTILETHELYTTVSTIDYDLRLFKDKHHQVFESVTLGYLPVTRRLIHNIVNINDRNDKSWTLLMVAAYHGHSDLIKFLLDEGADINGRNYKGTTVLMYAKDWALKNNNTDQFKMLIERGANLSLRDYTNKSLSDYLSLEESRIMGVVA
ncbi:ankyrin repeat domain-containing protein [Pseudomonas fluorescens]|uniref:ankyrin repeat domain-containing protein n=1 Tax=Pseudomonas fluorescens TaxID=294 RepID=UPI00352403E1